MAKKSSKAAPAAPATAQIFAAILGRMGDVIKGGSVTLPAAIALRRQGQDVVVCGPSVVAHLQLAQQIEGAATGGQFVFHAAHASS